jgi:SAM-dependent methyltransferase
MTYSGTANNNVAAAFSLYAEDYDRWFDTAEGHVLFESEVNAVRLLMKELVPPFLEIGTGSGRFAVSLGIDYGVEPADVLLKMALKRGVKVERAFGEKLPFPNGFFGGVFILLTLCFVKEPRRVIAEAKRVLKNGGGMILGIMNRESPWGKLYQAKAAEGHPLYKYARFYNSKEAAMLIEEAGLAVEAFSSILCQPPSEMPHEEVAQGRLIEDAGFVCIRARKTDNRGENGR